MNSEERSKDAPGRDDAPEGTRVGAEDEDRNVQRGEPSAARKVKDDAEARRLAPSPRKARGSGEVGAPKPL